MINNDGGFPPDLWHGRDLPVLRAVVDLVDADNDLLHPSRLHQATGLTEKEIQRSLRALERGGYLTLLRMANGEAVLVRGLSGEAYRAVGVWPSPDQLVDRVVAALEARAAESGDDQERGRLGQAAQTLASVGRDVLVQVLSGGVLRVDGLL